MASSTDRVTADSKPSIKMLQRHVIPYVATKWYELGAELFDEGEEYKLDTIESSHKNDVNKCCHEMFRMWLKTTNITWSQIPEALKSPGVDLESVAAELEKDLIVQAPATPQSPTTPQSLATLHTASSANQLVIESNHNDETLDFAKFEDVSLAFSALFSSMQKEVKRYKDFVVIKTACVARANQKLSKEIKKTQDIDSLFQLFADNKMHCNWLNVRFLEVIATASGNSKLINLIHNYKKAIYSKTLREVWSYIPYHAVRTKYYSTLQIKFGGKNPDDVTVEQFKKMCEPYLIKKITMLIAIIEENSIRITWHVPTNTVYEAYLSALMIPQELRLDSYLQIGDWLVHHPHHVLQNLQKDHWWIPPSTLLIGYYHSLLLRDIDPGLTMDKMCSSGLLAPHDQELILAGHSMHQRSWLLLEHVRHMDMQALVKFCEFIQEMLPQVGLQLVAALNSDTVTEPQYYAPDENSLVLKNVPYSSPSSLHILFLGLMDEVNELLQWCDTGLLTEICRNLMASETCRINLFSDSYINNLSDYTNAASLLRYLSFLFTWSDHSILRALVSCSNEAIQLLEKYDSFLDPFNTIASYPIHVFSLSMIPTDDSPYTILAIRCNKELWQCSLQYIFNIRSILVGLCEITQHCLQLLATQSDPTIFYWNIPKNVIELIKKSLADYDEYLCSQGIVEVIAYPKQLLFICDDVAVGSLAFMIKQEMDTEDEKQTSTEALLKAGNKRIDYLQSELNKSKQLGERFQEAAEKANEKCENLLTEYNKLKESSEKNTTTKLEKLQDKISDYNLQLDKKFKLIFPDCQLVMEAHQEKDPIQQVEYSLEKSVKYFDHFQSEYSKQQQIQLQQSQDLCNLKSVIEMNTKEANKNISYLQSELNESKHMIEQFREAEKTKERGKEKLSEDFEKLRETTEKDTATEVAYKLSCYNLELENKFKQIIPNKSADLMEPYTEKDRMQQLEYNLDHLQRLIKHFDIVQLEYDKQKQKELQLQDELHSFESELKVKTTKLKEENKMLLKRLSESKATSFVPGTSKPDNVNYPVKYGQLGSGLYGEVHRVHYKNSPYAGKVIHNKVLSGYHKMTHISMSELQKQLEIKCKSWAENLYHPNVEQFFEVALSSADDGIPTILTELLIESLTVFVERCKETIRVNQEIDLCNDMAQGIAYLHSYSLVHGNLHGNNVLITRDGHAKIADYLCPLLFSNINVDNSSSYLPPEILQNKTTPSTQSNIFTLGVLFLQVITRRPPQPRTRDSSYLEKEHDFAGVSSHHPLIPLIQRCLQSNEMLRPLTKHVCDELVQLIGQNNSPQRMAYKLLYTTEHKPLVAALTSGKQQRLQHLSCENTPARMFWGYAVVNNETEVYVTGSNSHNGVAIENVYRFSMLLNQWDKLPSTGFHHSVPIILKNKLTLIGGRRPGNKIVVSAVNTYDDGWKSEYPDMIQPRYRPAVVTFGDHVIVLGGRIKDRSSATDSIEVMNVEERKWTKLATCLPSKMYDMQATVSRDCVWIVGYDDGSNRSNKVYSIPVKDLISGPATLKYSFKTIRHDTLYYKMSVVPNSDPLVVLGGDNWRNKPTSAVVIYDYKTESWNEVASLSSPRAYCAVATVGECGLLIIGGCTETKSEKASNSSCLPTVELYYI